MSVPPLVVILSILPTLLGAWSGKAIHAALKHSLGEPMSRAVVQHSPSAETQASTDGDPASRVIPCPQCDQRLRVPAGNQSLAVTCPRCQHKFPSSPASETSASDP